jgi:hypothetical protein
LASVQGGPGPEQPRTASACPGWEGSKRFTVSRALEEEREEKEDEEADKVDHDEGKYEPVALLSCPEEGCLDGD